MSQLSVEPVLPVTAHHATRQTFFSFPVVLASSLAYLVFVFSRRNVADPDLWWHLRNAQQFFTTGHLAVVDSYSFTAPGASVLPFEWLAELPFYFAYKWAGLAAVFVLVFLLSAAIVLGVFRICYLASGDVKNSFVVSIGAAVLASVSIGARTLLFGWLCLVALMLILETVRRGGWKWLWLVPPLFCLWVNLHGSWPIGLVVFGSFIVTGMIEGAWGQTYATQWSGPQLTKLFIAAISTSAAVFVNPFGYRLVVYPFKVMFGGGGGGSYIQEFASIDFHTSWGKVALIMIAGLLLAALFSEVRWSLDEVALTLLALYFSLTYLRFMFLAGILLAPVFAKRLKLMTPYESATDRQSYNAAALAIVLCLFLVSVPRKFHSEVRYPEGALAYMKAHGMSGRVFNDWVWGGYLIWNAPESKVFIDGRGDPYAPNGVFQDYKAALSSQNPQTVLDKYRVDYVLMPSDSQLGTLLRNNPAWSVRFSDDASVLLQRSPSH